MEEPAPAKAGVIQTVRKKFTCRSCEKITQPPWAFSPRACPVGPFHVIPPMSSRPCHPAHVIPRGHVGPSLLAMILGACPRAARTADPWAKYGEHQPLNRQSESYARERVDLDVSTLADLVGACTAVLGPLHELIRRHVFAAERVHGDDTTVPLLARGKTITARLWTYVRDDRPFAGPDPPRVKPVG
jgi:transposase